MPLRQNREAISWNPVQMRQGLLRAGTPRDFADAKLVFFYVCAFGARPCLRQGLEHLRSSSETKWRNEPRLVGEVWKA